MSTMTQTNSNRKLVLSDILEQRAYERIRDTKRAEIIELKRRRRISLGTIVTVMFENRATMQSQIQEMLRVERVVSDEGVLEELKAYNPLIPEAGQLCATVFIELVTDDQMREWLPKLVDIEKSIAIKLANGEVVKATVDEAHAEQLTRETVTAAVHYIRFQFTPQHFATFAGRCPTPNALLLTTVERIGQTRYAHFALAADRFCLAAVFFIVWIENLGVKTLASTAASPSQIDFGHANPLVLVGQRLELGCHTMPIGKWL